MTEHWFYAGPYVPSGVVYGQGFPSHSIWLVPGYERWIDEISAIDVYSGPQWYRRQKEKK